MDLAALMPSPLGAALPAPPQRVLLSVSPRKPLIYLSEKLPISPIDREREFYPSLSSWHLTHLLALIVDANVYLNRSF